MKLGNEQAAGFWTPKPSPMAAVLARLESLSLKPEFVLQREAALARALRPYVEGGAGRLVAPLAQEAELAGLSLFCDFYPEDGQLTLVEQLRDVITEHIPNEERIWLDPLKHSYLDLLELTAAPVPGGPLALRSIGDKTAFTVSGGEFAKDLVPGQVLLTRVVRDPEAYESGRGYLAGCGLVLAAEDAAALYEATRDWERSMEMSSGSLVLGEWQEFAKRFGHIILWNFAELRFAALVDAVVHIRYRNHDGQPYLYAVALYDHHEYRHFSQGLSEMKDLEPESSDIDQGRAGDTGASWPARSWIQYEGVGVMVARLSLTSSQLIVECDSPERLDTIKHRLASCFGFSLHFRGETVTPPMRRLSVEQLMTADPLTIVVTQEEDRTLLNQFLEKAYLEWTDQPHHLLAGQTPRHAAAMPALRARVSDLIDDMERHDPGVHRGGKAAYSYNRLRAHVGLDEVPE
jgi:hypothetical protein